MVCVTGIGATEVAFWPVDIDSRLSSSLTLQLDKAAVRCAGCCLVSFGFGQFWLWSVGQVDQVWLCLALFGFVWLLFGPCLAFVWAMGYFLGYFFGFGPPGFMTRIGLMGAWNWDSGVLGRDFGA